MRAKLLYGITLVVLCGLLLFASSPGNSPRRARRHGPRLTLTRDYNAELEHIPFDPVVADLEQKRDDAAWQKVHRSGVQEETSRGGHLASGIDDFLDHHLEDHPEPDSDYTHDADYMRYMEDSFNFTARIEELFPQIDKDSNKLLSLEELWAWHNALAKNQSLHMTDREMSLIMHGKQGKVTLQDYLHDPSDDKEVARVPEHSEAWVAASRRKFPLADADGDGLLDRYEFDNFLHPEDSDNEGLHRFVRQEEIRESDTDGDGRVLFVEFLGGMYDELRDHRAEDAEDARFKGPDHEAVGPGSDIDDRQRRPSGALKTRHEYVREQRVVADKRMQRARRRFEELDRNGDGFVTEGELIPVMDQLNPGESYFARLQAESLLKMADDNKDGSLSLDEMIAHRHSFYRTIDDADGMYMHDEF